MVNFAPVREPVPPPPRPDGPAIEPGTGYRGAPAHALAGPYRAPLLARPSLPPRAPWWRKLRAALWSRTGDGHRSTLRERLGQREARRWLLSMGARWVRRFGQDWPVSVLNLTDAGRTMAALSQAKADLAAVGSHPPLERQLTAPPAWLDEWPPRDAISK